MGMAVTRRLPFARALQSPSFALLWTGQAISSLGDGAFNTAVAWQVLLLTGSATIMGLVVLAQTLPMLLFLLIGGVAADRFHRQRVMFWSDSSRAIAVLGIALLGATHLLQIWHLVLLSLYLGTVRGFFSPAYTALIPNLVEKEELASANALTELSSQLYTLLGPLLGAGCITLAGPAVAFAFDGFTFLISALCLGVLRLPATSVRSTLSTKRGARASGSELREGLRYVMGSPFLWMTITLAAIDSIGGAGALYVALPKLVLDAYGQGVWLLGTIWIIGGIGSLLAVPATSYINRQRGRGTIICLTAIGTGIAMIAFGLPWPRFLDGIAACVAMAFLFFGITVQEVLWVTVMQETVPDDKLGRVSSINQLAGYGLWPVGFLLTGVIADQVSPIWVFIGSGTITAVLYSSALCMRAIRRVQ